MLSKDASSTIFSLLYDLTLDWTLVSRTIGEHSTHAWELWRIFFFFAITYILIIIRQFWNAGIIRITWGENLLKAFVFNEFWNYAKICLQVVELTQYQFPFHCQ